MPRWLTKILSRKNLIDIQDNEISSYVSKALNRERISKPHDISGVDSDFYIRVKDYLTSLNEKERENLMVSLNSFVMSRLHSNGKISYPRNYFSNIEMNYMNPIMINYKQKINEKKIAIQKLMQHTSEPNCNLKIKQFLEKLEFE